MGIELYWDNDEQTVLLCEVDGPWTWDELHAAADKIKRVSDKAAAEGIDLTAILDVRRGLFIPGGTVFTPAGFENGMKLLRMAQGTGGTGKVVVVGAHPMLRRIHDWFAAIDQNTMANITFAATLDDARRMLNPQLARGD